MTHRILLGSLAGLLMAGCAVQTPPTGASIMPKSARDKIPGSWASPHRRGDVVPNWISSFNDPQLTALVRDAVERNPDLKAAAARVEASQHAIRVAASSLYPRIAMKGLGERQGREITSSRGTEIDPPDLGGLGVDLAGGAPDTSNLDTSTQRWVSGIGIGASWELDLWARVRSRKAAARAESEALAADYEYARQSLAAAVARAYFSAIEASQQEANTQETLSLYEDYANLTGEKKKQGHASDYDLVQIRSRTAGAKDTYFSAQAARAQAIRAIEVVTSNYPAGKLNVRRSFPAEPKPVPAGLPAQILERRPDMRAAEQRVAAAFHRTAEARAARLPRFSLSASSGMGTAQLDTVGVVEAVNWSLAAGVIQPIFFGGELKAAQDIRTAEQKAATASYVGAALRAFEDVEDALASDYYLRKREGALNDMVAASTELVKLGRLRLNEGQEDTFGILRLAGENLAAKIQLTQIRASRLRERVNLHLALGGDFRGTGTPAK